MDLAILSLILGIIASMLSLTAIGYRAFMSAYEKIRMEWIVFRRATYILNKFCGATSDSDNSRIVKQCAANIHCFNVLSLTELWLRLFVFWGTLSADAVNELLTSLQDRKPDVLQAFCNYYKKRAYDCNSFTVFKRIFLETFFSLDEHLSKNIRESFDVIFSHQQPFRPSNVLLVEELAFIASMLKQSDSNDKYIIVKYMLELVTPTSLNHTFGQTHRDAILNVHTLVQDGGLQLEEEKFNVVGALFIYFGNLNIMPANDLQLPTNIIDSLKLIDTTVNGVDPRAQPGWYLKASLVVQPI